MLFSVCLCIETYYNMTLSTINSGTDNIKFTNQSEIMSIFEACSYGVYRVYSLYSCGVCRVYNIHCIACTGCIA